MAGSEGQKDREKILNFPSEASEDGKEHKKPKGSRSSSRFKPSETLKLASTHRLVEGRNIGYSHDTNRSFHSRSAREYNRHGTLLMVSTAAEIPILVPVFRYGNG